MGTLSGGKDRKLRGRRTTGGHNICEASSQAYERFGIGEPVANADNNICCPQCGKWLKKTAQRTYRRHVHEMRAIEAFLMDKT